MQWKVSSSLTAFTTLFLLSAGDLVLAQVSAPLCAATTINTWLWSYNSLDQSPCLVEGHMVSTCYGGVITINPLTMGFTEYAGPSATEVLEAGPCWCNTVTYNLVSACSECQGGVSLLWAEYVQNCTTVLAPSRFPYPVPAGTSVPQWALAAIPGGDYWDPNTASRVGDVPETTPGELIDGPALVIPSHTTSVVPTPTGSGVLGSGNGLTSGQGASAGGVLWGVTFMAAIAGLTLTLIS